MHNRKWLLAIMFAGMIFSGCRKNTGGGTEAGSADSLATLDSTTVAAEAAVAPALSFAQRNGRRLYDRYCAVCHGDNGAGDGFNAYNLEPRPRDFTEPGYLSQVADPWLLEIIKQGGRGAKRSALMPAYEHTLTSKQIGELVEYVRLLSVNKP